MKALPASTLGGTIPCRFKPMVEGLRRSLASAWLFSLRSARRIAAFSRLVVPFLLLAMSRCLAGTRWAAAGLGIGFALGALGLWWQCASLVSASQRDPAWRAGLGFGLFHAGGLCPTALALSSSLDHAATVTKTSLARLVFAGLLGQARLSRIWPGIPILASAPPSDKRPRRAGWKCATSKP